MAECRTNKVLKRKCDEGPRKHDKNSKTKKRCTDVGKKASKEEVLKQKDTKLKTVMENSIQNRETGKSLDSPKHISAKRKKSRLKRAKKLWKMSKRKEKEKTEVQKDELKSKEVVHLPTKPEEFSSNWEKLKQVVQPSASKSHRRKYPSKFSEKKPKCSSKGEQTTEPEKPPDIWFDVDDTLLETLPQNPVLKARKHSTNPLVKVNTPSELTKAVALDCEFVGIGYDRKQNMLARVSIVNHFGHCVYDTFVKPQEEVTDYRTHVSGVRKEDIATGVEFSEVCKKVADIIKGRILVAHAVKNDLKVLYLSHPRKRIRDTSKYKPFRAMFEGKTPSLKKLTAKVLGVAVQEGEHSSVQDAQATMRLYTMYKQQWEKTLKNTKSLKTLNPRGKKEVAKSQEESSDGES